MKFVCKDFYFNLESGDCSFEYSAVVLCGVAYCDNILYERTAVLKARRMKPLLLLV